MKVFGIGWHRTGTTTLGDCFEILGLKHYGFSRHLSKAYLVHGGCKKAISVVKRADSFEDFPWPLLYKEMDQHFPEAKFILTIRKDSETWYNSLCKWSRVSKNTLLRKQIYGYKFPQENKEVHIERYERHNREVTEYFKGRDNFITLCWENGDGWSELCNFLDLPHPNVKLPHRRKSRRR